MTIDETQSALAAKTFAHYDSAQCTFVSELALAAKLSLSRLKEITHDLQLLTLQPRNDMPCKSRCLVVYAVSTFAWPANIA